MGIMLAAGTAVVMPSSGGAFSRSSSRGVGVKLPRLPESQSTPREGVVRDGDVLLRKSIGVMPSAPGELLQSRPSVDIGGGGAPEAFVRGAGVAARGGAGPEPLGGRVIVRGTCGDRGDACGFCQEAESPATWLSVGPPTFAWAPMAGRRMDNDSASLALGAATRPVDPSRLADPAHGS